MAAASAADPRGPSSSHIYILGQTAVWEQTAGWEYGLLKGKFGTTHGCSLVGSLVARELGGLVCWQHRRHEQGAPVTARLFWKQQQHRSEGAERAERAGRHWGPLKSADRV